MHSQRCSLCGVNYPPTYEECLRCGGRLRECDGPVSEDWRDAPIPGPLLDEGMKVEMWRLRRLLEAGYPVPVAEQLARGEVDLHQAVALVSESGCEHELAAKILL